MAGKDCMSERMTNSHSISRCGVDDSRVLFGLLRGVRPGRRLSGVSERAPRIRQPVLGMPW